LGEHDPANAIASFDQAREQVERYLAEAGGSLVRPCSVDPPRSSEGVWAGAKQALLNDPPQAASVKVVYENTSFILI
jgi:hypothetical protein